LESSFNPKAHSKAYAAGAWQFMPLIASYFLPARDRYIDYRFNIILSSIAAFHLLKQNIQILKSYDLAITSYNTGTKSIIKAKRKFNKSIDLEFLITNLKDSNSFGYASKNFYAEFLALTRVLAYKNEIFSNLPKTKDTKYYIYSSNCKFNSKVIINKDINNHIFNFNRIYDKKTLFVSNNNFISKRFTKIPFSKFKRNYPKYYSKRFGNKCL
jgi:membrane-bound lytic murein transglycosylase D